MLNIDGVSPVSKESAGRICAASTATSLLPSQHYQAMQGIIRDEFPLTGLLMSENASI